MSSTTLYRASGLALILGAVLGILGNVLSSVLYSGNNPQQYLTTMWLVIGLASFVGTLLLVVGLPGIAVRQVERAGRLGFIGFVLTSIGAFLETILFAMFVLILPWLAQVAPKLAGSNNGPPSLFIAFLVASVLLTLGGILLGIATMRAKILPRWAGLLLIIGAILNIVDFPLNGALGSIIGTVSFVLFALAFGWMGYTLMSTRSTEAVQPVPAAN
jgi:hypothetical protein